jgi:hypothetical protein
MRVLKLVVLIFVWFTSASMAPIVVGVLPDLGPRAESSMGIAPIPPVVGLLGSQ